MRKTVFYVIPLLLIMGCVSGETVSGGSGGKDLDAAIREAAVQMEAKIPAKTMIALVSVASSSAHLSEYIIGRLEAALVDGGKLVVVDRANLDKVRDEQGFQLSGEVDDNSAKNIGKLLGAGAIVTGGFTDLGDVYSLTLKAINIETATVAVSYPADIAKSQRIKTMLAAGGGAGTGTRTAQAGGGRAAKPAAPPPPAIEYKIGDTGPAGGIIFYDMGFYMDGWRYMEAAPQDFPNKAQFGGCGVLTETGVGSGMQNTARIAADLKSRGQTLRAAQIVSVPKYGGYDDWFLPSRDELNLMYENLKQKRIGGFSSDAYWSSSCTNTYFYAYSINFSDGRQDPHAGVGNDALVRAARRF